MPHCQNPYLRQILVLDLLTFRVTSLRSQIEEIRMLSDIRRLLIRRPPGHIRRTVVVRHAGKRNCCVIGGDGQVPRTSHFLCEPFVGGVHDCTWVGSDEFACVEKCFKRH